MLQVDTNPTIDVLLQVGAVSEQVLVEANAAQVETRTTDAQAGSRWRKWCQGQETRCSIGPVIRRSGRSPRSLLR